MTHLRAGQIEAQRESYKTHEYIPPAFVSAVQSVAEEFKEFGDLVLSTRGLSALPAYEDPAAPKPGSVKAKSSTQKFIETRLPVDPRLSRIEEKSSIGGYAHVEEKKYSIRGYAHDDFPRDKEGKVALPIMQERKNLNRIMQGIADGTYILVDTPAEIKESGILRVRTKSDNEYESAPIFSIHLNEGQAPVKIDREKTLTDFAERAPPMPTWWDPKNGDWSECFNHRFPAYVQFPGEYRARPLEIYGQSAMTDDGIPIVLPITSDIDGASLTVPMDLKKQMEAKGYGSAFVEIDTKEKGKESSAVAAMVNELRRINEFMESIGKPTISLEEIRKAAARMGNGTPFEVYISVLINKRFNNGVEHIRDPLQHGFENRNNSKILQDLDGATVHIGCQQGKKFMRETQGEKGYANFILKTNMIIERGDFHLNPGWNMEHWHEVVARKLELGQKVSEKTHADFLEFRAEQERKKSHVASESQVAAPVTPIRRVGGN
ncbi:MAG: hypothetical protein ACYCQI_17110 [Gammaproteobacteria bacterium]